MKSKAIEKIECIPILIKKIEGGKGKVILQDPIIVFFVQNVVPGEFGHRENYFRTINF